MKFAEKLKLLMRHRGLTQHAMGRELGIAQKSVGDWVHGAYPRAALARKLAIFFAVPVETLFDDTVTLDGDRVAGSATEAEEEHPDNQEAGQVAFEAKVKAKTTATKLRLLGDQIYALADELECAPVKSKLEAMAVPVPEEFKLSKKLTGRIAAGFPDASGGEEQNIARRKERKKP